MTFDELKAVVIEWYADKYLRRIDAQQREADVGNAKLEQAARCLIEECGEAEVTE